MRVLTVALVPLTLAGCSRFVWNEEPFTPDPAPVSEIIISAHDTTYVLRRSSYFLLASERSMLWQREVLDDVAWRYRELFGQAPSLIAIRVDTAPRAADATWRNVPLAVVALQPRRRGEHDDRQRSKARPYAPDVQDSVTIRLLAGPLLAATAAEAWLAARSGVGSGDDGGDSGGDPAGASSAPGASPGLPAWIQAGALRLLASPGAVIRAATEVRATSKQIVPLTTLFAFQWPTRPNAARLAGLRSDRWSREETMMVGVAEGHRVRRERDIVPGVAPLFIAQSVTVLAFLHERDPAIVARLADELARGRTVSEVLATTTSLPRDVPALETEWKRWVERAAKRR